MSTRAAAKEILAPPASLSLAFSRFFFFFFFVANPLLFLSAFQVEQDIITKIM